MPESESDADAGAAISAAVAAQVMNADLIDLVS